MHQNPDEVFCSQDPDQAFCSDCPDHEACSTGVPVYLVRQRTDAEDN